MKPYGLTLITACKNIMNIYFPSNICFSKEGCVSCKALLASKIDSFHCMKTGVLVSHKLCFFCVQEMEYNKIEYFKMINRQK